MSALIPRATGPARRALLRLGWSNVSRCQHATPPFLAPAASLRYVSTTKSSSSSSSSTSPSSSSSLPSSPEQPLQRNIYAGAAAVLLGAGVLSAAFALSRKEAYAEAAAEPELHSVDETQSPKYRLSEVAKHGSDSDSPWVVFGTRVYDITDWIPGHPGGDVILRAAGGTVDQYWKFFQIHHSQYVYDVLEQYFIGLIDPQDLVDGQVPGEAIEDPFKNDPARDERLIHRTTKPCNAETPAEELSEYITPNHLFYVRNHLWVPQDNAEDHKLTIELSDGTEVEYTIDQLRKNFKEHSVTAVLQCSGNRRSHNAAHTKASQGLQWDVGAIGNAVWTGVRLRDVLRHAGFDLEEIPDDVKHAQFRGSEAYGASIPIDKAVDARGDVILAYAMNGQTLPRDHGFPLRVVVPGHVAARSVKWVNRITLSDEESTSQWQRRDYKCFGPNVSSNPDWDSAVAIQETPVQSAFTRVTNGGNSVLLEGYAFSGGGRRIVRVDVSCDDGKTWQQAELLDPGCVAEDGGAPAVSERPVANPPPQSAKDRSTGAEGPTGDAQAGLPGALGCKAWGWQRWSIKVPRDTVHEAFRVKAVDEAYNTQPDGFEAYWNFRGNLTTGWHRVSLPDEGEHEEEKEK